MNYPKPYPSYKDSGVSWLGEVPEYWIILPGKACFIEKQVHNTGLKEKTVLSLSYGKIVVKNEEKLHGLVPASFETYQIIEPRDIIVRPTDLQNDWVSLRFGLSHHHGIITSAYLCFNTHKLLNNEYGHLLLHTYDLKKVFYGLGSGLRQNLDWSDFKYLPCVVPTLPEQTAIVRYLNYKDSQINRYIKAKKKLIELLNEQKQAIIHQTVTRGLDPNVRSKPSGIEWLGDIPEHWEIAQVKRHFKIQLGKMLQTVPNDKTDCTIPYLKAQHVQWQETITKDLPWMWASPKEIEQFGVINGDLLVCEGGEGGRCSILYNLNKPAIIQNALHRVRPIKSSNVEFLKYILKTISVMGYFDAINNKATFAHFTLDKFGSLQVPIPPCDEQIEIIKFIKEKNLIIQAAIDRAQSQMDLLLEFRSRIIADAVTGKIDVRGVAASLPDEIQEDTTDHETELTVDSDSNEEENILASETDEE
jgi:type I restriction enzyme S subunit